MKQTSDYTYYVQVIREPGGDLLAQEEWDEIATSFEEARYTAVSQQSCLDHPDSLIAAAEPVFADEGGPRVKQLRIRVSDRNATHGQWEQHFSHRMVAPRGAESAQQLIQSGRLADGDRYRVVMAASSNAARLAPAVGHIESDRWSWEATEPVVSPYPVSSAPLGRWNIDQQMISQAHSRRPVFIHGEILDKAARQAVAHGSQEIGTLLIGQLVEDPALQDANLESHWAVVATLSVDVPDATATATSFVYPPESLRAARQMAELRGLGEVVVGSEHSHGWRCHECDKACEIRNLFFSTDDDRMARQFPVFGIFLVTGGSPDRNRDQPVSALFVRLDGVMQEIPYVRFD